MLCHVSVYVRTACHGALSVHVARSSFVTSYRVSVCRTPKCVALCWQVGGGKDTDTQIDKRRSTRLPYAFEIRHLPW